MKIQVAVGLNYGADAKRVEAGETHDFPPDVAATVLENGWGTPDEPRVDTPVTITYSNTSE